MRSPPLPSFLCTAEEIASKGFQRAVVESSAVDEEVLVDLNLFGALLLRATNILVPVFDTFLLRLVLENLAATPRIPDGRARIDRKSVAFEEGAGTREEGECARSESGRE